MKRIGHLFEKICDYKNIVEAHYNASIGKSSYRDVIKINAGPDEYLLKIHQDLKQEG